MNISEKEFGDMQDLCLKIGFKRGYAKGYRAGRKCLRNMAFNCGYDEGYIRGIEFESTRQTELKKYI